MTDPSRFARRAAGCLPLMLLAVMLGKSIATLPGASVAAPPVLLVAAADNTPPECQDHREASQCGQVGIGWG
jgi:hypothetical protein